MLRFGKYIALLLLMLSLTACGNSDVVEAPKPNEIAERALQILTVKDDAKLDVVRVGLEEYFDFNLNVKYLNIPINLGVSSFEIVDTWYCENIDTTEHTTVTDDGTFVGDEKPINKTTWTYKYLVSCVMDTGEIKTCCVFIDFRDNKITDLEIYGL